MRRRPPNRTGRRRTPRRALSGPACRSPATDLNASVYGPLARRFPAEASRVDYVRTAAAGAELLSRRVDFALSLLSLQHAVPQLQVAAVEHLCDVLAPGGVGHVQALTHYDPAPYARRRRRA